MASYYLRVDKAGHCGWTSSKPVSRETSGKQSAILATFPAMGLPLKPLMMSAGCGTDRAWPDWTNGSVQLLREGKQAIPQKTRCSRVTWRIYHFKFEDTQCHGKNKQNKKVDFVDLCAEPQVIGDLIAYLCSNFFSLEYISIFYSCNNFLLSFILEW